MNTESYTRNEVAAMLGTSVNYLASKRMKVILPFTKDEETGIIRYDKKIVDEFVAAKLEKLKNKYGLKVIK